jgi:hypothetical protein
MFFALSVPMKYAKALRKKKYTKARTFLEIKKNHPDGNF